MGELNNKGNFYFFDGKDYKKLCEVTSVTINVTDEDSAKLWAQVEGLEIVGNKK